MILDLKPDFFESAANFCSALSGPSAVVALIYSARSARSQARATDVQTLFKLLDDHSKHARAIRDAIEDDELHRWNINEWLNHVEIVAALYLNRRFERVTRKQIQELLLDACHSIRYIDNVSEAFSESSTSEQTYSEIKEFMRRNLPEICRRRHGG